MTATSPIGRAPADVHAKALAINLDPSIYGSIAEIGAGQEVARWFLKVGGASGTLARTHSAYDKTFSDVTYGAGTRYVSKERLRAMLDLEYGLLIERLGPSRGATTRFFAFADTASARNYKGDNEQHAWVGLRFQSAPGTEPNDVYLHVNLRDPTAQLQQETLGSFGVNLVHAAFHSPADPDSFLGALWDDLSIDRLEVDVVELHGPAFADGNARACCLRLVRRGMALAVAFDGTGLAVDPATVLRKRPLLVDLEWFRTVEPFHEAMLRSSVGQLRAEGVALDREPVCLAELSFRPMGGDPPDDSEVLDRVGRLSALGAVIVTDFAEAYALAQYLRRYTQAPIRFTVGVSLLARLLVDRTYTDLPGRMLEGLGKLLAANVKVYAYPMPRSLVVEALGAHAGLFELTAPADGIISAEDLRPQPPVEHLYRYLREAGWVIGISAG